MIELAGFITLAAQQQSRNQGPQLMYLILMFGVIGFLFYAILMRPQKREQQERQRMLSALKKGDKVITVGGMHGTVVDIEEGKNQVVVEVAKNVKLTFSRTAVSTVIDREKEKA